ncbi:hypothetical protein GH714_020218 [Hevea brasiliensis]|uniref:PH domain-containing protein n=1 Tax=Hevea brasiliensis TaxID=3981 RepID=A0A6A6K660_HEVBR|nr:hypothetical protein GH714_020218 [Hevea brasiliensis]
MATGLGLFPTTRDAKRTYGVLSRSWSISALEVTKALAPPQMVLSKTMSGCTIQEDIAGELEESATVSGNPFSFASSETSQMVMERIMSQSQEVSPRTSGRLSHSSGPLNGSLTDSPPVSPSEMDDVKYRRRVVVVRLLVGGVKDRREKKKEETRAHNAHLHAAISVAGVAAAVAAIAAATAASSGNGKDEQMAKTDMAVASAATLVAAQCVEAAEAIGAERDQLASVVSSAVNVRSPGDIMTLTAAAATALRGAATLKARALKEVWNIAAVIPVDKGLEFPGDVQQGTASQAVNSSSALVKVMLKMKSRHVAGTITKKKKNVVLEVIKDIPAWPGRHLLVGGEDRRYFGLKTLLRGVVEFECLNQKEYDMWTQGVSRLLAMAEEKNNRNRI